jgi:hypothetical protein
MKRVILAGMFLFFFSSLLSLNAQWAVTCGHSSQWEEVHSLQQTSDGGYVVVGHTGGDIWILKLSSAGDIEWQKTYGGVNSDSASSIQQTNDGGCIIAGSTFSFGAEGDIWILKLSSAGDIEWQKTYGGSSGDSASFIQQRGDGGYIVVGHTGGDIWILKLSSAGDIEWQKTYGGVNSDSASFIQQTSDGEYIVVGHTESLEEEQLNRDIWILKISSGGDILWQKAYGGSKDEEANSFQQTSDGGYITAGSTSSFGAEGDIWILKLSSDGDIEWQKAYLQGEEENASSIQQTSDGGYIVAGSTNIYSEWGGISEGNIWILKLSSTAAIEWKHSYGGSGFYSASSIQQISDGGYIVAGSTHFGESAQCDDSNSLILKLSSTGDIEWQKSYGGDYSEDVASFIEQTSDEGFIVAGRTNSWNAWAEIWIFKLLPNGEINPHCAFIKSSNAEVLDTDIMLEDTDIIPADTDITPVDTDIIPQDTDITPQDSNANVCNLCSEICTLTLTASSGGTTDPALGTHALMTGTKVILKAIPSKENVFSWWSGNIDCDENPIAITMDGDKSINATFYKPEPYDWGGGDESGCFIATAAYGSPLNPHVDILRDFRDQYLMPSKSGRWLVECYYRYSPFVADLIAKHKPLKVIVRIHLLPVVIFGYSMVHLGPAAVFVIFIFIVVFPVFIILYFQSRQGHHSINFRTATGTGIVEIEDAEKRLTGQQE